MLVPDFWSLGLSASSPSRSLCAIISRLHMSRFLHASPSPTVPQIHAHHFSCPNALRPLPMLQHISTLRVHSPHYRPLPCSLHLNPCSNFTTTISAIGPPITITDTATTITTTSTTSSTSSPSTILPDKSTIYISTHFLSAYCHYIVIHVFFGTCLLFIFLP